MAYVLAYIHAGRDYFEYFHIQILTKTSRQIPPPAFLLIQPPFLATNRCLNACFLLNDIIYSYN